MISNVLTIFSPPLAVPVLNFSPFVLPCALITILQCMLRDLHVLYVSCCVGVGFLAEELDL